MPVDAVELHLLRIPFKQAFAHALKQRTEAETIVVVVHAEGRRGIGEIVPRPYLSGETIESVWDELAPARANAWLSRPLGDREATCAILRDELDAHGRELATTAGFELAVLDVAGQVHDFSLADALGGASGPELPPGVVLGFEVATAELKKQCVLLRLAGKTHVKVKVGHAEDLERIAIIGKVFGPTVKLRLDANAAWSVDEAIERLRAIAMVHPIASVEQPVAGEDVEGMRRVRHETGVRVMADESLCSLEDGRRLVAADAVDIFNIRIGKCGGVLGAARLAELARGAGLGVHLGALVGETAILSRAAEVFGRCVPGFECLEGKGQNRFLLAGDVADEREGFGLGLALDDEKLRGYLRDTQRFTR